MSGASAGKSGRDGGIQTVGHWDYLEAFHSHVGLGWLQVWGLSQDYWSSTYTWLLHEAWSSHSWVLRDSVPRETTWRGNVPGEPGGSGMAFKTWPWKPHSIVSAILYWSKDCWPTQILREGTQTWPWLKEYHRIWSHILFYFILFYFFNWSIAALQYCVSLYCIAKWISCTYAYIPSFLDFLLI